MCERAVDVFSSSVEGVRIANDIAAVHPMPYALCYRNCSHKASNLRKTKCRNDCSALDWLSDFMSDISESVWVWTRSKSEEGTITLWVTNNVGCDMVWGDAGLARAQEFGK